MKKKLCFLAIIAAITLLFVTCGSDDGTNDTPNVPTVSSVDVKPATADVEKGATKQFTAEVKGTNDPSQAVTWDIVEAGKHSGTTISTSGLLTVSASETLAKLTVKATSVADITKNGTAEVTVREVGTAPVVSSVDVKPPTATVVKGNTQQFTAEVIGTNDPSQAVTWGIVEAGKHSGTTISTSGLLTVSASETLSKLTVKATSVADDTKDGTADVTVQDAGGGETDIVVTVSSYGGIKRVLTGESLQFNATITGTGSPSQSVTWGLVETDVQGGTGINASGLLTVAASEADNKVITVKATSVQDGTKSTTMAVTVTTNEFFAHALSPSQSAYFFRANGQRGGDQQLHDGISNNIPWDEGRVYILDVNIFEVNPEAAFSSILKFRISNDRESTWWANGLWLNTPDDWRGGGIDDGNKPAFDYDDPRSENVITPLTGDFAGWYNVKMKFTFPGPGHIICGWGWDDSWQVEEDYTLTSVNTGDPIDEDPEVVISWFQSWRIQMQIKPNGFSYLIDNLLFYPENEGPAGNVIRGLDVWGVSTPTATDLPVAFNSSTYTTADWVRIPSANAK